MKREIKYRAKSEATNKWQYGYYFYDEYLNESFIKFFNGNVITVIDSTVGEFTGLKYKSGKECFEGDICFNEYSQDEGDEIIYYVCTWIVEWARFAWLNVIGEYQNYIENGIESLEYGLQETYSLEETEKYHYAGNIHDNPNLLNDLS